MRSKKRSKPEGRLFAIGDIHGCTDELNVLLSKIHPEAGDRVVFIGDYIDRGPSARDVVERLLELAAGPAETIFLKGNHEDMMLSYLGLPGRYGESFLLNGGTETLGSYGVQTAEPQEALEKIPETHLRFFQALASSYLTPPYLFVHAGIAPLRQLEEQRTEDLLWIRQEFILSPHRLGATVVFGHTPMRQVMADLPYKLGIDTGLVYGGSLSCIELGEGVLYQIARGSRGVKARPL